MKSAAIILAGGSGKRFAGEKPKQFVSLSGKPVIEYSIDKFGSVVDEVVIVSHPDFVENLKSSYRFTVVAGGETRQLSVKNGLESLYEKNIDYVAIHDSARPLVSQHLIKEMFKVVLTKKAVIPVIPSFSTMCRVEKGTIKDYIPRGEVFLIQTPQLFDYSLIYNAHKMAFSEGKIDFTDDSQLLYYMGKEIFVINGEETNIKITTKFDLELAETLIKRGICY